MAPSLINSLKLGSFFENFQKKFYLSHEMYLHETSRTVGIFHLPALVFEIWAFTFAKMEVGHPVHSTKGSHFVFYVSADHSPVGFRPSPTHMRLSPSPPASSTTSNGGQSTSTPPPTYARVSNLKKNHGNSPTRNVRYIQNHWAC